MSDLSIFKLDTQTINIKDTTAREAADSAKTLATTASGNATTALNKINELESEKADAIISSASGAIASFQDGAEAPVKSLTVGIEPVQEGTGDPSPDNVRPITGWTGCVISHSGADTSNPTTYPITFPTEAGTVYGGTDEVVKGELTRKLANIVFDGSDSSGWRRVATYGTVTRFDNSVMGLKPNSTASLLCNYLKRGKISTANLECCNVHQFSSLLQVQITTSRLFDDSVAGLMAYFSGNPLQVVYELVTPQTYHLTPQEITTLLGQNNIWADAGDTSVTYRADTKLYIDKKIAELQALILEN